MDRRISSLTVRSLCAFGGRDELPIGNRPGHNGQPVVGNVAQVAQNGPMPAMPGGYAQRPPDCRALSVAFASCNGSVTRVVRAIRRHRPRLMKRPNAPIRHTVDTGSKTRRREPWRWYAPHRAIVLLGVVLTLIALAGAFLGVANASQAESATTQ